MTKVTGMGDRLLVGGVDVSGDINAINKISGGNSPLPFTDITQFAMARQGGRRDGSIDFTSYFDPAAGASHATFSALPTADTLVTYCHGYALGAPSACLNAKQINYDGTRPQDGSFTFAVSALGNQDALEWGVQASAGKQTDTVATNGTGVDQTTVSTAFGWQAYAQVTALTGTNVILTLQDSADNISFANFGGGGGAFTSVTAVPAFQRIASPGATDTVRRYVRIVSSGTFSSATFVVMFVRNLTAVAF
jgi:hypothetical protein